MEVKSQEGSEIESSLVEVCGENLVFSLGNVLRASSKHAAVTTSEIKEEDTNSQEEVSFFMKTFALYSNL